VNGAYLAAAATGVQVGAALVASAAVVGETGSGMLGLLRYGVALLVIAPMAWRAGGPALSRRDLLPVALMGMAQFGVLIALLNVAVQWAPSAHVALVFATLPLLTLGVAWLMDRQPVGARALLAIGVSVAGVGVLLGAQAGAGGGSRQAWAGLGCAALATVIGAVCSALYRPYLRRYGVMRVSPVAMVAALPLLVLLATVEGTPVPVGQWPLSTLALILAIGLSSGVGYLLWLYALQGAPAGVATAFLGLSPVTALLLSVVFLGAALTPPLLLACALVVGSLVLLARPAVP